MFDERGTEKDRRQKERRRIAPLTPKPIQETTMDAKVLNVAIIGTAGRKEDATKMSKQLYGWMFQDAKSRIEKHYSKGEYTELNWHCGGAAWADHLCISLFKSGMGQKLTLHLPTEFAFQHGKFFEGNPVGPVANKYHEAFSGELGVDTLASIAHLMVDPRVDVFEYKGFFERNIGLGLESDYILAYTWGTGPIPKEKSGTLHCWRNSPASVKVHIPLQRLVDHYGSQSSAS